MDNLKRSMTLRGFLRFIVPRYERIFGYGHIVFLQHPESRVGYVLLYCSGFRSDRLRREMHDSIEMLLSDQMGARYRPGRTKPYFIMDSHDPMSPTPDHPKEIFIGYDPEKASINDVLLWIKEAGLEVGIKSGPVFV